MSLFILSVSYLIIFNSTKWSTFCCAVHSAATEHRGAGPETGLLWVLLHPSSTHGWPAFWPRDPPQLPGLRGKTSTYCVEVSEIGGVVGCPIKSTGCCHFLSWTSFFWCNKVQLQLVTKVYKLVEVRISPKYLVAIEYLCLEQFYKSKNNLPQERWDILSSRKRLGDKSFSYFLIREHLVWVNQWQ